MSYTPNLEKIDITDNATGRTLELDSNGNAALILNADQDNDVGEVGAPYVQLKMDNSLTNAVIGQVQETNKDPTGSAATNTELNALYVGTTEGNPINFATNKDVKLRIAGDSSVIQQRGNQVSAGVRLSNFYSVGYSQSFIDSTSRNGGIDSAIIFEHQTDGASSIAFQSQPAGTFTDRRLNHLILNTDGSATVYGRTGGTQNWFQLCPGQDNAQRVELAVRGSGSRAGIWAGGDYIVCERSPTPGAVKFPSIGTTASGANAFLNSGSENQLLRSTSSIDYKKDIEPIEENRAEAILGLEPVWYRSKAIGDKPEWSHYGLIAESVAQVEPRLVHYAYKDEDYDLENDGSGGQKKVLKEGATLKPDGVQYDRLPVLMLEVVKRMDAQLQQARQEIETLKSEIAILKG